MRMWKVALAESNSFENEFEIYAPFRILLCDVASEILLNNSDIPFQIWCVLVLRFVVWKKTSAHTNLTNGRSPNRAQKGRLIIQTAFWSEKNGLAVSKKKHQKSGFNYVFHWRKWCRKARRHFRVGNFVDKSPIVNGQLDIYPHVVKSKINKIEAVGLIRMRKCFQLVSCLRENRLSNISPFVNTTRGYEFLFSIYLFAFFLV